MSEGGSGGRAARVRRWLAIVSLVGLTSTLIVLGLEFTTADHYGWDLKEYARHLNIGSFLVPIVLVGVVVFGLLGLLGHLRWAIPLALMVGGLMLTVNLLKLRFRDEPLYPSDFAYIGETDLLVSSVGIWPALILVGVVLGVGIFTWLIVMGLGKLLRIPPANRSDHPRWVLAFRVLTVAAAAVLMVLAVGFNAEGNPLKRLFERSGAVWIVWSQNVNYKDNGFFAGFLFNMPSAPMAKPEGYGRETALEAAERYAEQAREINASRDPAALDHTNVVIILGESFFDPTRITGLELAEDPIPFTRSLMAETMSGTLQTIAFGGGTANVEFEVLTGMLVSDFAQAIPPYQGLVSSADAFPSVLTRFADTHTTIGIHPFVADFYRRGDAYRTFGFDQAKFLDGMGSTWKVSTVETAYVADGAAYEELLGDLRASDEPVFAKVVTMQNHAGYAGLYPDPIPALEPASARESWGLSDYLRGLRHADDAIKTLVRDLNELGEPTVVLFYGDHAPPRVIPGDVWDAQTDETLGYQTPWFVWSTEQVHPTQHQGLLSPTHLWNQVLRAMDAPVTGWDALLLNLEAELAGTEASNQAERDHLLLQYDLAVGAGYTADVLLGVPEP